MLKIFIFISYSFINYIMLPKVSDFMNIIYVVDLTPASCLATLICRLGGKRHHGGGDPTTQLPPSSLHLRLNQLNISIISPHTTPHHTTSKMEDPLPPQLKIPEISRLVKRATQTRSSEPAIAYWCTYLNVLLLQRCPLIQPLTQSVSR